MSISALIHTKNSATTIRQALESVTWVDEIVIVDMKSSDTTIDICKQFTDKIYPFDDVGYVEPARNFGINKTTGDWVLIVDADEEIPVTLADKLRDLSKETGDVWRLPRKNLLFGQWIQHAGWWPDYQVRFFRKGAVVWSDKIHSSPSITGTVSDLPANERFAILHHNYASISDFVTRLNKYTTVTANETGRTATSAFSSFWKEFERRFFDWEGYKDGEVGLYASMLQSFYEAVVDMKLWEKTKGSSQPVNVSHLLHEIQKELAYWRADYEVKTSHSFLKKLYWQMRRKYKR